MKYSFGIVIALIAFVAFTKADSEIDKHMKQAADTVEQVVKKMQEYTGIQTEFDKQKLEKFLKETFGKAAENLQELYKKLEKEHNFKTEDFKKHMDTIIKSYNDTIKNFNSPEVQNKFKTFQENSQASLKKAVEQMSEVVKAAGVAPPPKIEQLFKDIFEDISKTATKVSEKFQAVVGEAQKEMAKKNKSA